MRRQLFGLLVVGLACLPFIAQAETMVTTGKGRAPIQGSGQLAARGEAINAAVDDALVKTVAKLMDVTASDLTDEQTDVIESKLLTNRREYLEKSPEVVSDGADESGKYLATVRATFNVEKLRQALLDLKLQKRARTWQRIMVVLPEKHLQHYIPDPAAETEIVRNFLEARYRLVDPERVREIKDGDQMRAFERGDNAAAAAIARKAGAEIFITGQAFSVATGSEVRGMPSCAGHVEARMLNADTGELLVAVSKDATASGMTEEVAAKKALTNAGALVAQYFLDQLDKRAREDKAEGAPKIIELVISDASYAWYVKIKDALQARLAGIQTYHQISYENKRADLEVEFTTGDAQTLADAIAKNNFQTFKLTVVKATPNRIDMLAAPK
jgi:hypothetical protein